MLSETQIERYSRQIILPEIGGSGQARLLAASCAVWGVGDLARTAALYVAAAGVGALQLVPELLAETQGLNPDCQLSELPVARLSVDAVAAIRGTDVILAAGAGEPTCRLLNAACLAQGTPLLWGEATNRMGWCMVLAHPGLASACYECRPHVRVSTEDADAALPGVPGAFIGALLATEAIKMILGVGTVAADRMLVYEALEQSVRAVPLERNRTCSACSQRRCPEW